MRTCTEAASARVGACCPERMDATPEPGVVTLLIVEETAAMCRLIRALIDGLPVSVTECRDGRDTMALCRALQPDWVVLDLDLAGTDALATAREIRLAHPAIRIVALGEDSPRLQEASRRAGAQAYLAKEQLVSLPELLRGDPGVTAT